MRVSTYKETGRKGEILIVNEILGESTSTYSISNAQEGRKLYYHRASGCNHNTTVERHRAHGREGAATETTKRLLCSLVPPPIVNKCGEHQQEREGKRESS